MCNITTLEILYRDIIADIRRYSGYIVVEELGEELIRS